jgi:hypothetical protein
MLKIHLNNLLIVRSSSMCFNLRLFSRISSPSRERNTLLHKTHLRGECRVGDPGAGLAGCDFLQHLVNLFEGETLCLGDQEVRKEDGDDAEGAPHEEDLGGEVRVLCIDEVGGDDGNDLL